ncbi:MAG: glucosamine-6-phosphate deaminase [Chthonomonadales bacterium]
MPNALRQFTVDRLHVRVYPDRESMGAAVASDVAFALKTLQEHQAWVRMVFAAAPSQNEFLAALAREKGIEWQRVAAFHMDEYVGLPPGSSQLFRKYLRAHLFDKVQPGAVHYIGLGADAAAEAERYAELVEEAPIDIVCLGIGENGHIAFNDPAVADFCDPLTAKVVDLDEECRAQQVHDGCFASLEDVPRQAITLTIPALMSGRRLFCTVPGSAKRKAVLRTLRGPITTSCPASILRTHPDCTLYLDAASAEDVTGCI